MKRLLLFMSAVAMLSSCNFIRVKPVHESSAVIDPDSVLVYEVGPATKFVTREYEVPDFREISSGIPAVIHYHSGTPSLKVKLPEDLADLFCQNTNYQNDSTGLCPGFTRDVCIEKGHIEIWASSSHLDYFRLFGECESVYDSTSVAKSLLISLEGKSKLVVDSMTFGHLQINARAFSECTIKSINCDRLYCDVGDFARVSIGGCADKTNINPSGFGTVYLKEFTSPRIIKNVKDKGRVKRLK